MSVSSADTNDGFEDLYQLYQAGREAIEESNSTRYKNQFEDVTQLSNPHGMIGNVFKTSEKGHHDNIRKKSSDKKFGDIALLLRRTYHINVNGGDKWSMRLEIQSPVLRKAFKEIATGFTANNLDRDPIVIDEPFSDLYFCGQRIQQAIQETESEEVKSALGLLENFRQNHMKQTIDDLKVCIDIGLIGADDLWSLFAVGSTIILQNEDIPGGPLLWCVTVRGCFEMANDTIKKPKRWSVHVEFTSFNGNHLSHVERSFPIGGFKGRRNIRSLPAYPLDLHPQKDILKRRLIERGRKYVDIIGTMNDRGSQLGEGAHRNYCGPFWSLSNEAHSDHRLTYLLGKHKFVNFHNKPDRHVRYHISMSIFAYVS
jgi:hypothetical protein